MDDQEFRKRADAALQKLYRLLVAAGEDYGFDADFKEGAISIELDDPPARFVVSPNAPVKQIWVSANVKSYKLDWDEVEQEFVLPSTGQHLQSLIEEAIGKHSGDDVNL